MIDLILDAALLLTALAIWFGIGIIVVGVVSKLLDVRVKQGGGLLALFWPGAILFAVLLFAWAFLATLWDDRKKKVSARRRAGKGKA